MKKFDADDLDARSPQQIERILPLVRWYTQRYVRLQVTGLEHLQPGPVLTVGNHAVGRNNSMADNIECQIRLRSGRVQ